MADTVFCTDCRIQHGVVARNADHSNATPWRNTVAQHHGGLLQSFQLLAGEQKHRQPWFTVGVRGYITESRRRSVPIRTRGMHPSSSAKSGGVLRPRILSIASSRSSSTTTLVSRAPPTFHDMRLSAADAESSTWNLGTDEGPHDWALPAAGIGPVHSRYPAVWWRTTNRRGRVPNGQLSRCRRWCTLGSALLIPVTDVPCPRPMGINSPAPGP